MSYLANLYQYSLTTTKTGIHRAIFQKPSSLALPSPNHLYKSSYHLNTSNLNLKNPLSSSSTSININTPSIRNYVTKQCCILSPISTNEFHDIADELLENLTEKVETILEHSTYENYDTELSSGVLTIKLGSAGTYVINKQTPNRQIWYSSPISGPKKFYYDPKEKRWICATECDSEDKDRFLEDKLAKELSQILKQDVEIGKMNDN